MNVTLVMNVIAISSIACAVGICYQFPMYAIGLAFIAGVLIARTSQYSITLVKDD
jgi:hypothetical protein